MLFWRYGMPLMYVCTGVSCSLQQKLINTDFPLFLNHEYDAAELRKGLAAVVTAAELKIAAFELLITQLRHTTKAVCEPLLGDSSRIVGAAVRWVSRVLAVRSLTTVAPHTALAAFSGNNGQ